jgi:MtaA/CmuA family methyltransferase
MNGFQRISAAFRGEWPDTTPVMLHNFMMAAREAGVTMRSFRTDPRELARSFIEAVERYGYDGIVIDVDTATLAAAAGVPIDAPEDEPARTGGGLLRDLAECRGMDPVDLRRDPSVQVWLEGARLLAKQFGNEVYLRGNCDQCPFTLAGLIRGMDHWMIDLLDPDKEEDARLLLDTCAAITNQFIDLMAHTGVHMTSNGDSLASPDLISPQLYHRFALPYDRQTAGRSHLHGLPHVLHICGDTTPILLDLITGGSDGLEIDYRTDIRKAHATTKDRVVFIGNIDPANVLALGTPALVRQKTQELLEVFSDTPRFVLNAGCAIPPHTPSENIKALIRAAREFSRPLPSR